MKKLGLAVAGLLAVVGCDDKKAVEAPAVPVEQPAVVAPAPVEAPKAEVTPTGYVTGGSMTVTSTMPSTTGTATSTTTEVLK